ncbi:hypothetical protein C8J56DRAFT_1005953 [Mycena floridula]|nr:hypothetical protein C8J56DRAFT_1005953 [Mycena floridula]
MALVCHHDIPLFLANIDTPGEQQKYTIALLEMLFNLIPLMATVVALYDIGCVLDRSLKKYDLLPTWITCRIEFATSAMHTYGHQWSCQLIYNLRLRQGLGLSDGEGVERLWSRLRKLIGVERRSTRARQLEDGLGEWISNHLFKGLETHIVEAQEKLNANGISVAVCQEQWALQKEDQLSKELDKVLALQSDIEGSLHLVSQLTKTQSGLKDQVEALYASLNMSESFPELKGVPLELARTLFLARDLKINIRKNVTGTKLHQKVQKNISSRKPALTTSINKYNGYVYAVKRLAVSNPQIVRQAIQALLKLDQCLEERRRLGMEAQNLCRSFGRKLTAIEVAR